MDEAETILLRPTITDSSFAIEQAQLTAELKS